MIKDKPIVDGFEDEEDEEDTEEGILEEDEDVGTPIVQQPELLKLVKNRPAIILKNKKGVTMAEKKTEEIALVEVPTQTTIAFRLEDGRVIDERALLLEIYKDIKRIKEAVA